MGDELQKQALDKIIRSLRKDQQKGVQLLIDDPNLRIDSPISFLQNNKLYEFKTLYSLPTNILNQLTNAGINLDPLHKVNGKTAFYYAIFYNTANTLRLLYSYATKTFHWTGSNPRNPNQQIVEIMKELRTVLTETKDLYLALWEKRKPSCIVHIDEIIQFNKVQLNLCEKLLLCPPILRSCSSCPLDDVRRRKATLCTVLNEYGDCFNKDPFSATKGSKLTFEVYEKYKNYFCYLDNTAAAFFFDHEYLVKDSLILNNGEFDVIESSFIEFLGLNYFDFGVLLKGIGKLKKKFPVKYDSCEFDYLLRNRFCEILENFRTQLNDTDVTTENIKERMTIEELRTLKTQPVIKDTLLMFRLQYYLKCAIDVNLDEEGNIGPLIIERALQVLAECIKTDFSDSYTIMKCLLSSYFLESDMRHLKQIRNALSHYMSNVSYNRLEIEKHEKDLFQDLQSALRTTLYSLQHCYVIQGLRLRQYICKKTVKLIRFDLDSKENVIPSARMEILEEHLNINISYNEELQKIMQHILENNDDVLAKHFQHIFCWIDSQKDYELSKDLVEKLKDKFNIVQGLLKFLRSAMRSKLGSMVPYPDIYPVEIKPVKKKGDERKKGDEKKKGDVERHLNTHIELVKQIFSLASFSTKNINTEIDDSQNCKSLERFEQLLNENRFLSPSEIQSILSSNPQLKSRHDALMEIKQSPERHRELNPELLSNLNLSNRKFPKLDIILKRGDETALQDFISENDRYTELKIFFSKTPINIKKYIQISKKFGVQESMKHVLEQRNENPNDIGALDFLLNRIDKLNTIINDYKQDETCNAQDAITQIIFFNGDKPPVKIAIECLLFDCMVVVKDANKDNKHLFEKINGLLKGILFRNVLAHGNPLYEAAVQVLDRRDEVKEIVEKVLEFIEDKSIIHAMCQIRSNIGFESGTFSKLVDSFDSFDDMEKYILTIQECKMWSKYNDLVLTKKSLIKKIVDDDLCDEMTVEVIHQFMSSTGFESGSTKKFVDSYRDQRNLIERIKACERWRSYANLVDFSQERHYCLSTS